MHTYVSHRYTYAYTYAYIYTDIRARTHARTHAHTYRRGRSPSPLITGQRSSYIPSPDPTGRKLPPSLLPREGQPINAAKDIMQATISQKSSIQ